MSVEFETIAFKGWPHALRMSNGTIELIATLDVGPRILSYTRAGGLNPFNVYEDQAGGVGEPVWRNRGGHRLWLSPEAPGFSDFPDNHPVAWEKLGETGVRLTPAPETGPGFQKQIDIVLTPKGSGVTLTHRITRIGKTPCRAAPWALSVMAAGGAAIIPQPPLGVHPRDLLPNRRLVIWPYTDLTDPRYHLGPRYITLRQDAAAKPTKIGLALEPAWAGYLLKQTLFLKKFPWLPDAEFPAYGCNIEVFTNARMLELESLGPMKTLAPGEKSELKEVWDLKVDVPELDPRDEAALDAYFSARGIPASIGAP